MADVSPTVTGSAISAWGGMANSGWVSVEETMLLFEALDDGWKRLRVMDELETHLDREAAVEALAELALRPADPEFGGIPEFAIEHLTRMGPEGRRGLRRLHESGRVTDPIVRRTLANLAKTDFVKVKPKG